MCSMDRPAACHTKWSELGRGQISYDIPYMQNLKKGTNELSYKIRRETHRCRKQTDGYQKAREQGIHWEIGIDAYTLWQPFTPLVSSVSTRDAGTEPNTVLWFFLIYYIYLDCTESYLWHTESLVMDWELLVPACGI